MFVWFWSSGFLLKVLSPEVTFLAWKKHIVPSLFELGNVLTLYCCWAWGKEGEAFGATIRIEQLYMGILW